MVYINTNYIYVHTSIYADPYIQSTKEAYPNGTAQWNNSERTEYVSILNAIPNNKPIFSLISNRYLLFIWRACHSFFPIRRVVVVIIVHSIHSIQYVLHKLHSFECFMWAISNELKKSIYRSVTQTPGRNVNE